MADRRELICERLLAIVHDIPGITASVRNKQDAQGLARPAAVVHDGHEEPRDDPRPDRRSRVQRMQMLPVIHVLAAAGADDVGTLLNVYRARLVTAVIGDTELLSLVCDEDIDYRGCALIPPQTSTSRETRIEINFALTYVFRVSDLTAS